MAQLSLIEHALCPLDFNVSLRPGFVQHAQYSYTDRHRNRKTATARVVCPDGLSASDEFYLWGLLAVTFAQRPPEGELFATPHYCLRQMGCIEGRADKGGETYQIFRDAIGRLSAVNYQNDHFYDPVRGEHRRVGFGFLSYSLPLQQQSSRAWRIAWDPIFFEFCQATGSVLSFDLPTYKQLNAASRRLYLLLKKVFWRSDTSPAFDLRNLAVNVIGFSATLPTWKLKQKLLPCIHTLIDAGILRLPLTAHAPIDLFSKRGTGAYSIQLHRGPHFDRTSATSTADIQDSPSFEQLKAIGFDVPGIRRILTTYKPRLIAEWADITLAAKERNGEKFFTSSAPAYFIDNIRAAAGGQRTPPDWWHDLRREEDRARRRREAEANGGEDSLADRAFEEYLRTEAKETLARITDRILTDLKSAGQPDQSAKENAVYIARMNLRGKFRSDHPEYRG